MILGRYGNPLTWEILNFLRKLFDEGLLGFSREFSLFTVFLHAFLFDLKLLSCNYQPLFRNNNFLTSKNFIYENGTQIQFLSIIINEQEKIWQSRNEIGREMNVYLFGKIVWKTKSCSLMNAISKRSLCGTLVTF
ncbi:ANL_collapsed_G0034810.mRNA.1.CDS.1 [Saccharomyces cerevisiae]|nr:ANL_collapsed_G0034810.mRNA.1.CDS.1 [Saccharomyces cerevisiae]CAI7036106.1 BBF_collapsed_G0000850.mRNA.1.CDS.1 [Saccharomyces cerevisiae]